MRFKGQQKERKKKKDWTTERERETSVEMSRDYIKIISQVYIKLAEKGREYKKKMENDIENKEQQRELGWVQSILHRLSFC